MSAAGFACAKGALVGLLVAGFVAGSLLLAPDGVARHVAEHPGQNTIIQADESRAILHYEARGDLLELNILVLPRDEEDGMFRTRIALAEGQTYSLIAGQDEGRSGADRYVFGRANGAIYANVLRIDDADG